MVKLNQDAFATVNAAYPNVSPTAKLSTSSVAAQRQGVGAPYSGRGGLDMHKRVLQVGSKKQKQQAEEEMEEDFGIASDSNRTPATKLDRIGIRNEHVHDDDDDDDDAEEDVGRTAIHGGSKRVATANHCFEEEQLPDSAGQKKKKKKLGKRERQEQKATIDNDGTGIPAEAKDVLAGVSRTGGIDDGDGNKDNGDVSTNKKRKRRKVRSRQKNIRKDNRETKPAHLVPGNADFRGRPLTAETRRKLNMSESRRTAKLKSYWQSHQAKSDGGGDDA